MQFIVGDYIIVQEPTNQPCLLLTWLISYKKVNCCTFMSTTDLYTNDNKHYFFDILVFLDWIVCYQTCSISILFRILDHFGEYFDAASPLMMKGWWWEGDHERVMMKGTALSHINNYKYTKKHKYKYRNTKIQL